MATGAVLLNRRRDEGALARAADKLFPPGAVRAALEEIRSWSAYESTPLVDLTTRLPGSGQARRVVAKLERSRFGLGSFKVLGGAYAVVRHANEGADAPSRYVCGSMGNHGLSVAWGARRVGCAATVFVPRSTSEARIARLRAQEADVRVVTGDYEDALRRARETVRSGGDVLVSDISDEADGTTAPVLWGYALIVEEIAAAGVRPTHLFVPAGVGSLAAAMVAASHDVFAPTPPRIVAVEAAGAPCVSHSLRRGRRETLTTPLATRLAPLACPVPSADAWPLLAAGLDAAVTVTDEAVRRAAGSLGDDRPPPPDNCGSAALAGFFEVATDPSAGRSLGLGPDATVVVLVTE